MACELARHGIQSRVVERNAGPSQESRAIAIQPRTLEVLAAMGLVDAFLAIGHQVHGACIFAEDRRILHLSFDELASRYPLALDLPQSETERLLLERLADYGIEPEYRTSVTGVDQDASGVTLSVQRPKAPLQRDFARYVIGCDGANSVVRHALALPLESDFADENFLIADVLLDWNGPDYEWTLWFHRDGLLTMFPLPGGLYRIVAESAPHQSTAQHLSEIVEQRCPSRAHVQKVIWLSSLRLTNRRVTEYRRGRVFIAGDAAHVHSPVGAQGMNTGIQDAHNLAWKLAMVLRGNASDCLLDSYTCEREPIARSVLTMTDQLTAIASLRQPISQQIRNRLLPILGGFDVVEQRLVSRFTELDVNYRRSPIVSQAGRWSTVGPMPGDRAIDGPIAGGCHISDLLRQTQHVLLMFAGDNPSDETMRGFENIERYMRQGYAEEVASYLVVKTELNWDGESIFDRGGDVYRSYSATVPCLYLIRPDGYIAFRSLSADPLPLLEYLNQVYEPSVA